LESVVRLEGLVEGLMALARVHAGQVEEGLQPEHLSSLVSVALATERGRILARGGEVEVALATDPELVVHGPLLTAAIANRLRNAADHAPGAAVRVTVEPSPREGNDGVTVTVDDNGPGQGSSEPHGLGIGLRVCREVLARHGGSVHTGSSPTGGMRARLWLPLGRA
jgi:signal transduction histidine kinase